MGRLIGRGSGAYLPVLVGGELGDVQLLGDLAGLAGLEDLDPEEDDVVRLAGDAREGRGELPALLLVVLGLATLLRSRTSSLITHSSSDSMASMMSLSPARVNAASSSARLWICLVLLSTLSDSASRLAWTESYPALMHTVARGLREEGPASWPARRDAPRGP